MKTIVLNLVAILLLCSAIAGCKKNNNDQTTKSYLKVDGIEYDISQGFIIDYGPYNAVYSIDLYLASSGIIFHEIGGLPDSVSGTGNGMTFEILSSDNGKLALGDYIYSDSDDGGTFYYAEYIVNWNATQQPDAEFLEIVSGTMKVIQNGAEYELSFSGTNINNKPISGYYKGKLSYYNYFGNKKSFMQKHIWK